MPPSLRYARTDEGVTIAYTRTGHGPPLVWLPPQPFSNVYGQWRIPSMRDAYERLGEHLSLVLFDGRGTGHSQRDVSDLSLEAMIADLEAVVDDADIGAFALLGYYYSVPTAIAFAARHPERVTRLVLFGGSIDLQDNLSAPETQALLSLVERDWDLFVDSATLAWAGWTVGPDGPLLADAFRASATPAMTRAILDAAGEMDVTAEVGSVEAPALVLHRKGVPIPVEVSQRMAEALPDGRFIRLEGVGAGLLYSEADEDLPVLLDFLVDGRRRPAAAPGAAPSVGEASEDGEPRHRGPDGGGVFISVSERQKEVLARPFKALLAEHGMQGYIVSDEPRPESAWTPEEKVDAYLERSDAVVVFATADVESGEDRYTRPNIGDEVGRARSKPHLRGRVCVLKERGVTLPSNINPAYESLDLSDLDASFGRALLQLQAWGLPAEGEQARRP